MAVRQVSRRAETSEVKSARRVLEVFEMFSRLKRPASVTEIQLELGYPQSSTSVLLKSLHSLGYLGYDADNRVYAPTVRFHLIGAWLQSDRMGGVNLDEALRQLSRDVGETVVLGVQNGIYVQYIQIHYSPAPMRLHIDTGILRPLCHTAAGKMLMTLKTDRETRSVVGRTNATPGEKPVELKSLSAELDTFREQGYALNIGSGFSGYGGLAMLMPEVANHPKMVVAAVSIAEHIRRRHLDIVRMMRSSIAAMQIS